MKWVRVERRYSIQPPIHYLLFSPRENGRYDKRGEDVVVLRRTMDYPIRVSKAPAAGQLGHVLRTHSCMSARMEVQYTAPRSGWLVTNGGRMRNVSISSRLAYIFDWSFGGGEIAACAFSLLPISHVSHLAWLPLRKHR